MLFCPHHHPSLYLHHRHHRPNSTTNTTVSSSSSLNHQTPQNATTDTTHDNLPILRTHNSKSTSLLLHHHLKQPNQLQNVIPQQQHHLQDMISPGEIHLLTKKRTPRFPGSLTNNEDINVNVKVISPDDDDDEDDEKMIMRAVEIRRKVTAEVFKEAMKKGKFGITYSTNLVSRLDDFIDYVMIEAVAMKRLPEFELSSFNVRAKTVIEDLNVVPLIR